ncbi:MAG: two-component system, NtrC family, sensor histidine kinase HydH [Rhodospirillaceae bacterium]|nr:two-component system, NtrC family, sensor histidine kinase HydH [Rhodospirillaceae bacterium]
MFRGRQERHRISAGTQPTSSPFSLLRWFSLLSLACIALIGVALSLLMSGFLADNMLKRDSELSQQFVSSIAEAESAWVYFEEMRQGPPSAQVRSSFDSFLKRLPQLPEVARANVYGRDRSIIWSNVSAFVGHRFDNNPELEKAFAGELAVESGTVGARNDKSEHVAFDKAELSLKFVETYIPIWNHDRSAVVGVVEIYRLPSAMFQAISRGQRLVWATGLAGAVLLYVALFWIVRRASTVIQDQQRQLVQSETMAATGEMASAVAHSIRNSLASIRSSAELALDSDLSGTREAAGDIIGESDRLEAWVRDLLGYSRGESGAPEPIDLATVIRGNLQGFAPTLSRQNIAVTFAADDPLPPVRAGAAPLEQAFNSLITNAIDAMPGGGRLSVIGRVDSTRGNVEVQVQDTGHGLDKQAAGAAFRPFFTTKRSGLGLGLALSRRIVERYGGTLELASIEGQGTTVTMRLPAAA